MDPKYYNIFRMCPQRTILQGDEFLIKNKLVKRKIYITVSEKNLNTSVKGTSSGWSKNGKRKRNTFDHSHSC